MYYVVFSFSHKTVSIENRDKLAFNDNKDKKSFLNILLAHESIEEIVLLSTCNRTEFILYTQDIQNAKKFLFHELSFLCAIDKKLLENIAICFKSKMAIEHIFKVASSLESIVVGETQITGQLKDAYKFSVTNSFCAKNLSRVIHQAFKCAGTIRNKTNISKDNTSVVSVALSLLKKKNISLEHKKVLIVGAGEMSNLALKYFVNNQAHITLVNRTLDTAKILAQEIDDAIEVERFENLSVLINKCDIIFTATSSKQAIIKNDFIKLVPFKRYWFDMALPQDIEDINNKDIHIYNIDSLKKIIQDTKDNRKQEAKLGEIIVQEFVEKFIHNQTMLDAIPVIKLINTKTNDISKEEIKYAISKGYIKDTDKQNIQKILNRAFSKLLHTPFIRLKDTAYLINKNTIGDIMEYLFNENSDIQIDTKDKNEK